MATHHHPPPPPRQVRHGYALRPDVHALVEALLRGGLEVPQGYAPEQCSILFKALVGSCWLMIILHIIDKWNDVVQDAGDSQTMDWFFDHPMDSVFDHPVQMDNRRFWTLLKWPLVMLPHFHCINNLLGAHLTYFWSRSTVSVQCFHIRLGCVNPDRAYN